MNTITRDNVTKLAALSGLQLEPDELDAMVGDLDNIIGFVEQLKDLDVGEIEPTYQTTGLQNVYRKDEVVQSDVRPEVLSRLAPESVGNQIKVPKVL